MGSRKPYKTERGYLDGLRTGFSPDGDKEAGRAVIYLPESSGATPAQRDDKTADDLKWQGTSRIPEARNSSTGRALRVEGDSAMDWNYVISVPGSGRTGAPPWPC